MTVLTKRFHSYAVRLFLLLSLLAGITACAPGSPLAGEGAADPQTGGPARLRVIATTSILGDVVSQVGGDRIDLEVLLPRGSDPHGFEPAPRDMARIADADLVFASGAGLEEFLQPLLQNAGGDARAVDVSEEIELLEGHAEDEDEEHEGQDEHAYDPHVWMDPNNVITWTMAIEKALSELDPANAAAYAENARSYRQQLEELDAWIRDQVAPLPAERRVLVVDHLSFTYFATRYGFQQAAAIIPGFSTLAEPSAQDLAQIEQTISELGVRAIFVGESANPSLARQIASDTGARLVRLYTGSLSEEGGEAATYLEYMRFNVSAVVNALGD